MYVLIVLLPLLGSLIGLFLGRFLNSWYVSSLLVSAMFVNVLASFFIFYEVALCGSVCSISLGKWMVLSSFEVDWFFLYDSICAVMLIVVNLVSLCVHVYSVKYMEGDPYLVKFMSYLSLFTFFMILLVTAGNFPQLFIGWEGVGLASFLLISFWSTRHAARLAALKAMLVNRVGDLGLMLAFALSYYLFGSLDFGVIFALSSDMSNVMLEVFGFPVKVLSVISLLIFVGAVGKSAQLGLHVWLPDAMEGPTPVSALIHAATMVTAGVFVIVRCSPIFEMTPAVLSVIAVVGGLTAVFSALCGCVQYDIKKVIAYSTCSQLGYMVFVCGLSGYSVGLFHLMNHAFFKALLFLSAGAIIHAVNDEQDLRRMGGLISLLPFTYLMVFIGSLALMGFPFLTGFYSKDVILELAFVSWDFGGRFSYWLGLSAAFFTAYYSMRLLYQVFVCPSNGFAVVYRSVSESDWFVLGPLTVLFFGSVFAGYGLRDMFIGAGTDFWKNAIYLSPDNCVLTDGEFLPWFIKMAPFFFSCFGVFCGWFVIWFFSGARWRGLIIKSEKEVFYWLVELRTQFNFMIMFDVLLCAVFLPWFLWKVVFVWLFSVFESCFLYVIFLLRQLFCDFASFVSDLQSGNLVWYFGLYFVGIQVILIGFLVVTRF